MGFRAAGYLGFRVSELSALGSAIDLAGAFAQLVFVSGPFVWEASSDYAGFGAWGV